MCDGSIVWKWRGALACWVLASICAGQPQFIERGALLLGTAPAAITDLALGDVDGDGNADLVYGANGQSALFLSNDRGGYVDVTATHLPAASWLTVGVALGDLDGDGDLDLILANGYAESGGPTAEQNRLYANDGSGRFNDVTSSVLPSFQDVSQAVVVGDLDGDGDLDLVFANYAERNRLYLNNGGGTFADATDPNMPNQWWESTRSAALGDVDGDGDLDLLLGNGEAGFHYYTENELYLNDGTGFFVDVSATHLPSFSRATYTLLLEDVDGDGDLDYVELSVLPPSAVSLNDGTGRFTLMGYLSTATGSLSGSLGDIDGDGDLDLLFGGSLSGWLMGDGAGGFTAPGTPLPLLSGFAALHDVDADGDPDFVAGDRLYRNDGSGWFGRVTLPSATYETRSLAVGDVDGDGDEDLVLGKLGSGAAATNRLLFNDGTGTFDDVTGSRLPPVQGVDSGDVSLGDADGDGDLDLVLPIVLQPNRLFFNDGTGTFTDVSAARLPSGSESTRDAAFVDVDGDGDLDLVFANGVFYGTSAQNRLYLNDGTGTFSDVTASRMPVDGDDTLTVSVADVDGDGDADLVFGNVGQQSRLYVNQGGVFTDATSQLPQIVFSATEVAAADVDGDGDLDLAFATGVAQSRLYLNDGTGAFTDVTAANMPVETGFTTSVAAGDADGDGDVDLAFANNGSEPSRLYLNDGTGRYTVAPSLASLVRPMADMAVALHDLDGDGDLDLVLGRTSFIGIGGQSQAYFNLQRQLDAPVVPERGRRYDLDLYAKYAPGSPVTVWPMLATARASFPLPPWGTLMLAPRQTISLPPLALRQPGERKTVSLRVPPVPALAGVPLFAQAVFGRGGDVRLSNLTADSIR